MLILIPVLVSEIDHILCKMLEIVKSDEAMTSAESPMKPFTGFWNFAKTKICDKHRLMILTCLISNIICR